MERQERHRRSPPIPLDPGEFIEVSPPDLAGQACDEETPERSPLGTPVHWEESRVNHRGSTQRYPSSGRDPLDPQETSLFAGSTLEEHPKELPSDLRPALSSPSYPTNLGGSFNQRTEGHQTALSQHPASSLPGALTMNEANARLQQELSICKSDLADMKQDNNQLRLEDLSRRKKWTEMKEDSKRILLDNQNYAHSVAMYQTALQDETQRIICLETDISDKDAEIEVLSSYKFQMEDELDLLRAERTQLEIDQNQLIILSIAMGFGLMVFGALLLLLYCILRFGELHRRMDEERIPKYEVHRQFPSMPQIKEEPEGQEQYQFEVVVDPRVIFNLRRGEWPPEPFDSFMQNSSAVQGSMMDDVVNEMVEDELGGDARSNEGFVVTE